MEKGDAIVALKQRMTRVTPLQDEPNFATSDETIVRFLKANDWKYKDAEKALLSTVEYRRQTRPLTVDCQYCHTRPGFHSMRQVGFDESGRPVMYSSFAQASVHKNTVEDLVTHVTYLIENAKVTMNSGVTTWVFVIDWMTMGACNPKLGYNVTSILSSHYPERLGMVICVNISPVFHGVWKAIKKLLSPGTVSKVRLVRSESKIRQVFGTFFSDELSAWLLEEIALNKCKPLSRGQLEFWNPPSGESRHDPRGTLSYVHGYINQFKLEDAHVFPGHPKKHLPHPNIIDALSAVVAAVSLTPSEEAEREEALGASGRDDSNLICAQDDVSDDDDEDSDSDAEDGDDRLQEASKLKPEGSNAKPKSEMVSASHGGSSGKPMSKLKKWITR
ncbi:SEC14 cytosolic factor [Biomphalaria pfeifferi]|uniref:SEC14 cytosolic factor n=1 Tax=Biomphalaria pfeifferi TaxID=112525 RepID=A0AAD8B1W0_BIOPF|nr:SEC14 cytosolic factor [Biomphalaria pfeifferi]